MRRTSCWVDEILLLVIEKENVKRFMME